MGTEAHLTALRMPGALDGLAAHGVPTWVQSIATQLGVIGDLDRQLAPLERDSDRALAPTCAPSS